MSLDKRQPPIVALDFSEPADARSLVERLSPEDCRLKIGKELFVSAGPSLVGEWVDAGWDVFLDLKFHDIPNTVAGACRAAARLGVWMLNVHALGGRAMMQSAMEGLEAGSPVGRDRPLLTAVTVLTSHDADSLAEVGVMGTPEEAVSRLARLADEAGLDGVVCSAQEAMLVAGQVKRPFRRITPGIRPRGAAIDDQSRILTPAEALAAGATDLVVGRPVTRAKDPVAVLQAIRHEMGFTASD